MPSRPRLSDRTRTRRGQGALLVVTLALAPPLLVAGPTAANSPDPVSVAATPAPSPTTGPSVKPTPKPTPKPTLQPTAQPTAAPSAEPSAGPSAEPTDLASGEPTGGATAGATDEPSADPSQSAGDESRESPTGATGEDEPQVTAESEEFVAAALDIFGLAPTVAAAAVTTYPGLPAPTGSQYDGVGVSGLTEVLRSRQYIRVPGVPMAADVVVRAGGALPQGFIAVVRSKIAVYVVSPKGAEHAYGDFPAFRTRLLAFGALPVEATVHLSQLRDADDLPVAMSGAQMGAFDPNFFQRTSDAQLSGLVDLRVSDVTLDGVPIEVGEACHVSSPASLELVGAGYWSDGSGEFWTLASSLPTPATRLTERQVKSDYYGVTSGGLLSGTLDVPAFTGCTGPQGDVSALVTTTVSAPDQPIQIRQSGTFTCFPPELVTDCTIPEPFPYPSR